MISLRKFFKSKSAIVLATATGALTFHAYAPHSLSLPPDFNLSNAGCDGVEAAIDAVVRSSRAISTVAVTLVDYKYSLHGLPWDSDEYRHVLSEVHLRSAKRVLRLCEANKGFYIKAGQFVAALGQAPREYVSTLSALQDKFLVILQP